MARPKTRGTEKPGACPAAPRRARPYRLRMACVSWASGRIRAARSGSRRRCAASPGSSRRRGASRARARFRFPTPLTPSVRWPTRSRAARPMTRYLRAKPMPRSRSCRRAGCACSCRARARSTISTRPSRRPLTLLSPPYRAPARWSRSARCRPSTARRNISGTAVMLPQRRMRSTSAGQGAAANTIRASPSASRWARTSRPGSMSSSACCARPICMKLAN